MGYERYGDEYDDEVSGELEKLEYADQIKEQAKEIAELKSQLSKMEGLISDKLSDPNSPFGREVAPAPIEHEQIVSSDDVGKIVIDETGKETETESVADSESGKEASVESYDQSDLVQEWEDSYSSVEEVDSEEYGSEAVGAFEALSDYISSEQDSDISSDDFGFEFDGDLGSEDDGDMDSEMDSESDSDSDMDMDYGGGGSSR